MLEVGWSRSPALDTKRQWNNMDHIELLWSQILLYSDKNHKGLSCRNLITGAVAKINISSPLSSNIRTHITLCLQWLNLGDLSKSQTWTSWAIVVMWYLYNHHHIYGVYHIWHQVYLELCGAKKWKGNILVYAVGPPGRDPQPCSPVKQG